MHTIDIDFDVFKALTAKRDREEMTHNDVLRRLLGLPVAESPAVAAIPDDDEGEWWAKGVRFPSGTRFRGKYKGLIHSGVVLDGALVVKGKRYNSPSAAAVSITESPVNGWTFWEAQLPGRSDWQMISSLRK